MKRIIGLISANYTYGFFSSLLDERPLASLPFGGRYRLVDFPMSNLSNSGITTVGLITPYMYRSLMDHIGNATEWTMNRKSGGLFFLPGTIYGLKSSQSKFLIRDLIQNRSYLERGDGDLVVITACNKIFNVDYREIAQAHEASGAQITMLYKKNLPLFDAEQEYYLKTDDAGRVCSITESSEESSDCFLDAMIIDSALLLQLLDWYAALPYMDLLEAIGENLDRLQVAAYGVESYAACVNGLQSYKAANYDLLHTSVRNDLFFGEHPIITKTQDYAPTIYSTGCIVKNAIIPSGCIIDGMVENSVIFRGVKIHRDASVHNCILLPKCEVGEGAEMQRVICDKKVNIQPGVKLFGNEQEPLVISRFQKI